MKLHHLFIFCLFLTPLSAEDFFANPGNTPVKVIFDTDMGNDVDDALALAILHNMQTRGKCELLGVTLTKDHPAAARFVAAFNAFYGRPEVPVGAVKDGKTQHQGNYLVQTLETKNADGQFAFPVPEGFAAEDAVVLLRKLLAAAEDASVVIAQVGFSTNLARLLDTEADEISPLDGKTLAAKKVRLVSIMAGDFRDDGRGRPDYAEYNVHEDIPSAKKLYAEWPGEMTFSGFEVGEGIHYQPIFASRDFSSKSRGYEKHILQEAYRHYRGLENGQPTWDLTSVLFVVRPDRAYDYFTISAPGTVAVLDNGGTVFTPDEAGNRRFFKVTHEQRIRITEAFGNLCSE